MADKRILKGTLIIAVAVMISRVLGVLRDVLLAHLVGSGMEKSAYDLAFLVPDMVNHLISTGYLSITFIPIFSGFLARKEEEKSWDFFSNVLKIFSLILIPVLALCWIFIRPLLELLTVSNPDAETIELAVRYSRIILPAQICFFYGAIFTAIQHVRMQFLFPALMGLIYNTAIILGGWWGRSSGLEGFAWGVLVGAGVGSFGLQLLGGRRAGMQINWSFPKWDAHFSRYLYLTLPLIFGLGAVFALEFVFRSFGAKWGPSGIASLGYAYRIMYTLVAVFGFAVGAASYPFLSKLAKENKFEEMNNHLFHSLSQIACFLLPAVVLVWYFAEPITQVLFQRGSFTEKATTEVAGLLKGYVWASFALSAQIILIRCFYAREKMWLPTLINSGIFAITLPLYSFFSGIWGIYAIPVVGTVGALIQVFTLLIFWVQLSGSVGLGLLGRDLFKIFLITGIFGLGLRLLSENWIFGLFQSSGFWETTFILGIFGGLGYLIQIFLQLGFGVGGAKRVLSRLTSRG